MEKNWLFSILILVLLLVGLTTPALALDSGRVDSQADIFLTGSQSQPVGADVAIVPDMNGDGYDELAVGGSAPNRVYVVLGGPDGWGMNLRLSNSNPGIITYTGDTLGDLAGFGVAGVGDVNGDGYGDLLVGAPSNDLAAVNAGAVYLVFGSASMSSTNLGAFPIMVGEAASDEVGRYVSEAGDVNGDGFQDMLVGVPNQDSAGSNAGTVYLILGSGSIGNASLGSKIKYTGEASSDLAGAAVDALGDMNGDGYMDFVVGASSNDDGISQGGAAYVVLGSAAPTSGSLGSHIQYTGSVNFGFMGQETSGAGDFNGDGYADMFVSGPSGATPGLALVLGSATPTSGSLAGSIFYAGAHGQSFIGGYKYLARAGDINGDGYGDVLIGYPSDSGNGVDSGAVYVAYGTPNPVNTLISSLPKLGGAAASDGFGTAVRGNGDVNGDGLADIVVSTLGNDEGGANAGGAYVLFGGDLPESTQERQRLNPASNLPAIQLNTADIQVDFVSGALLGGDVTVKRHFYHPCASAQRLQTPIWTLDSSKLDGTAAMTVRFTYTNAQTAGMIESNLRVWTRPAGEPCSDWTPLVSTVNASSNAITTAPLTTLGQFTISEGTPNPTAIEEITINTGGSQMSMESVLGLVGFVVISGTISLYLRRPRRSDDI